MAEPSPPGPDRMTLMKYVLSEQRKHPMATGDLTQLMEAIMTAVKDISRAVRHAALDQLFEPSIKDGQGKTVIHNKENQGKSLLRLHTHADDLFIRALRSSYSTGLLISKKSTDAIGALTDSEGKYVVCFDPLNGSQFVDSLEPVATTFAVFKKTHAGAANKSDALQKGHNLVAAGYALYGSATIVVLSLGADVNGFTLDSNSGDFILTDKEMKIPPKGKQYSINENTAASWPPAVTQFVSGIKANKCSSCYVGSLVADVHRILKHGGLFLAPSASGADEPKYGLLYECFPLAYIIEKAGGLARAGGSTAILDLEPRDLHDTSALYLGSKKEMDDLCKILK